MDKISKIRLQNAMNNSMSSEEEGAYRAKKHYAINDRVHLKGTKANGTVVAVIFKQDKSYPVLRIKWDDTPADYETQKELEKKFYDPYDIVPEKSITKSVKVKKHVVNQYLELIGGSK